MSKNIGDVAWDAFELAKEAVNRGLKWVRDHAMLSIVIALVVIAIPVGLSFYQSTFKRTFILLTGPAGTSSWRTGEQIAEVLRGATVLPGIHYQVEVKTTEGFEDSEEMIVSDQDGQTIGFLQNRAHAMDSIRTLVPLDYDYLHIIVRTGFLAKRFPATRTEFDLTELVSLLGAGKVFAGPERSGTRAIAARIFKLYGKVDSDFTILLNTGIDDWLEARDGLKLGQIDAMFFMGPLGSTTIEQIAIKDESAVLVGINDIVDALVKHESSAVYPVAFPPNAYRAGTFEYKVPESAEMPLTGSGPVRPNDSRRFRFCPRRIDTIAVRRLFVGSDRIPAYDAFQVAAAVNRAIGSTSREIGDWKAQPPLANKSLPNDVVGVTPHPGVLAPPSTWLNPRTWPPFWMSIGSTFALFMIAQGLSAMRTILEDKALERKNPKPVPVQLPERPDVITGVTQPTNQTDAFERELADMNSWLRELEQSEPLKRKEWKRKERQVTARLNRIRQLREQGNLSDDEAHSLVGGLREAWYDLDFLKAASS